MKLLKLKSYYSEKVWGYEKWILSTHKNGYSFIEGEEKNLFEYLNQTLPILIKEIKADQTLSVQVHPSDEYAMKNEGDSGKTECWYIVDCKEDAHLVCGIAEGLNREKFKEIIKGGKEIEKYLTRINIKKGDLIYIKAGTVHAIEGGIKLIEIQQSSDVTYRLYDWGRDREIHVEKALDVINFDKQESPKIENFKKLQTPYFNVEKIEVNGNYKDKSDQKYNVYISLSGECTISTKDGEKVSINSYESVYIENGTDYEINGNGEFLKVY